MQKLNSNNDLNIQHYLSDINDNDSDDVNPYNELIIDSSFYDVESFINKFKTSPKPLFLSINVQSLSSKYEKLKNLIQTLGINGLSVDIIALQETWTIKYPQLLTIPGYQNLFYLNRQKGRGGGSDFL